jgi:glucose-6-phosphate isomerase
MYNIEYHNINLDNTFDNLTDIIEKTSFLISQKAKASEPYYKVLSPINTLEHLSEINVFSERIKNNFSDLLIISMGGASLNPSSVISLVDSKKSTVRIHFLHNTDPYFFSELLNKIDLKNTAFLTISNSGKTLETISILGCIIEECRKDDIPVNNNNFYFITDNSSGKLKDIADQINGIVIPHQRGISGRFSGLSNVTTLAAMVAGFDASEYLLGANQVIDDFHQNPGSGKPEKAALSIYRTNQPILVNIGYLQRFETYLEWYSQIIAESLGKNNLGYTPIRGLGPNDQHSLFQLYLEGAKDKLFTIFYVKEIGDNVSNFKTSDLSSLGNISNKKLHDINRVNFDAATTALIKQNSPVRKFFLNDLSERSVGALIAHSMIEIITLGHLMRVNPFNQQSVELIKQELETLMH